MQKTVHMGIAEWRAALSRGELWMFVDLHWDKAAPEGLTDQEWDQHFAALVIAKTGFIPKQVSATNSTTVLVCTR